MTWIAAAIGVYIVAYTLINLGYRKENGAHEPWAEALERRENVKEEALLDWTRLYTAFTPAEAADATAQAPRASISRSPAPGRLEKELPIELVLVIPARPELARAPIEVLAPATVRAAGPWRIAFQFGEDQQPQRLGEFLAYARDQHLWLFLQNEKRPGLDAAPTPAQGTLEIALPTESLAPGEWTATLHCADAAFTWPFVVE